MNTKILQSVLLLALLAAQGTAQITLQLWTEVFGVDLGEQLGTNVRGIAPTTTFPYRAAVSKIGSTGVYSLETQLDTSARRIFFGDRLLTCDLNRDQFLDVILSKRVNGFDTIYIYWGTPIGIDTLHPLKIPGENQGDFFGASSVGDINNDGFPDLIATAPGYPAQLSRGKIYIFQNPITSAIPQYTIEGDSIGFTLGIGATTGDINNDGFNDLIIGGRKDIGAESTRYQYVNIYWGAGVDTVNLVVGRQLRGSIHSLLGIASFDVNGDGVSDLLWTNRDSTLGQDYISVHFGQANFDTLPSMRLRNPGVANFGFPIVNCGDMNGDGYDDILVAAYRSTNTSGFVFVFGGGPQIDGTFDAAVGMDSDSDFGASISTVGDVNGDGLSDIIVGAPAYEFGISNKGYWGIFKGDSTIRVTNVKAGERLPTIVALHQAYPNPFNPRTTIKYELSQSADVLLQVFTILGQQVVTLQEGNQIAGTHSAVFDGTTLASGVYLCRLNARTQDGRTYTDTKKLTLVK